MKMLEDEIKVVQRVLGCLSGRLNGRADRIYSGLFGAVNEGAFLVLVLALLISRSSVSAQSSASLSIGGTVSTESMFNLSVVGEDAGPGGQKRFAGVLTAKSNHQLGYSVSVNRSNLKSGQGAQSAAGLNGTIANLVAGPSLLSIAGGKTGPKGLSQNVSFLKSMETDLSSGDILILTIAAN